MLEYVDSHNHIYNVLPIQSIFNSYRLEDLQNIDRVDNIHKSVGLHPMHLPESINYEFIESLIVNREILIGEIGLDKRGENKIKQKEVLIEFISMANRYKKSVTFHCVKSWGDMIEIINNHLNKELPHLFHSFNGSIETVKILNRGNSFYSFSLKDLEREKIIQLIKSIPIEKLLIESDITEEQFKLIGYEKYKQQIIDCYDLMAKLKNIPHNRFVSTINSNFKHFIKG